MFLSCLVDKASVNLISVPRSLLNSHVTFYSEGSNECLGKVLPKLS